MQAYGLNVECGKLSGHAYAFDAVCFRTGSRYDQAMCMRTACRAGATKPRGRFTKTEIGDAEDSCAHCAQVRVSGTGGAEDAK